MIYVLKNALTRRMFWLFLVLALTPTLLVMFVPTLLRVQQEQQAVRALETDLKQKAEGIFIGLVDNKAKHYEQVLTPYVRLVELLARTVQHAEQVEDSTTIALLDWLTTDDHVRVAFVQGATTSLQYPSTRIRAGVLNRDLTESAIFWELTFLAEGPILTIALPVHTIHSGYQIVGIEIWLDKIVNQVPRYGIADGATLVLVSEDGRFITMPVWGKEPRHLALFAAPPSTLIGKTLDQTLKLPVADLDLVRIRTSDHVTGVFPVRFGDEAFFLAFQQVGETPIRVMLLLPLVEVFNKATFYGASLNFTSLPILSQVLISGVGFALAIILGALFTLREIAVPIRELARGARAMAEGNLAYRVPVVGRDEMRDLAQTFNTMGQAIQRNQAQLAQALVARQSEFNAIRDIAGLVNLTTDLPDKLNSTLVMLPQTLGIWTSAVFVRDENSRLSCLARAATEFIQTDIYTRIQDIEQTIVARVLEEKHCVSIEHFCFYPKYAAEQPFAKEGWIVGIPIQLHQHTIGVMVLSSQKSEGFSNETLTFLDTIATHIAILIENARLQSQARYVVIAEERRRLARELHDSVTQSIFSLSLAAEGAKAVLGAHPTLDFLVTQATQVRQEMRGLINELRPIDLDTQMLDEAIQNHAASLKRATGLEVQTHLQGDLRHISLPIQHNLNRILQEALSNVSRHAHATCVDVSLLVNEDSIILQVSDDGRGFVLPDKPKEQLGSLGLISMRERAEMLGGTLTIDSAPHCGTRICVSIPLPSNSSEMSHA